MTLGAALQKTELWCANFNTSNKTGWLFAKLHDLTILSTKLMIGWILALRSSSSLTCKCKSSRIRLFSTESLSSLEVTMVLVIFSNSALEPSTNKRKNKLSSVESLRVNLNNFHRDH